MTKCLSVPKQKQYKQVCLNLSFPLHRRTSVWARRDSSKAGSPFIFYKHPHISFPSVTGRGSAQLLTQCCAFVSLAHVWKNRMEGWDMAWRPANSSNCAADTFCHVQPEQKLLCWTCAGFTGEWRHLQCWECLHLAPHTEPVAAAKNIYSDRSARQSSLVLARCERWFFFSLVRSQLTENC